MRNTKMYNLFLISLVVVVYLLVTLGLYFFQRSLLYHPMENNYSGDKLTVKIEKVDIKTEDRFGVTLSTEISEKILFNGKIGVPIGGIEETLIIGDVQIDFILNVDGSLKAKVFNRENEFRYIGDKLGYTQGVGLTYQVDFQTFRDLISKLVEKNR